MAGILVPILISGASLLLLPNIVNPPPPPPPPDNTEKFPEYDKEPIDPDIKVTKSEEPLVFNKMMKQEVDNILSDVINVTNDLKWESMEIIYDGTNDEKLKKEIIDEFNQNVSDIKVVVEQEAILLKNIIDEETNKLDSANYEKSILNNKIIDTKASDLSESEKSRIIFPLEKEIEEINKQVNKDIDTMINTVSEFETEIKNIIIDNVSTPQKLQEDLPPEMSSTPETFSTPYSEVAPSQTFSTPETFSTPYSEVAPSQTFSTPETFSNPREPPPDMSWSNYIENPRVNEDTTYDVFNRDPY